MSKYRKMELFAVILLYASQESLTTTVKVYKGEESIVLPCQYSKELVEIVTVKWGRCGLSPDTVHQRREGDELHEQNQLFRGRTSMSPFALDTGDFSLILKEPQLSDSGIYSCSIIDDKQETVLSDVQLQVKEIFPTWAVVLLVLLVLLAVSGGLLFHFRQYLISVYKVEVDSGVESVLLPFKTTVSLPEEVTVMWRNNRNRMVHSNRYKDYQHKQFINRTEMKINYKSRDFSLTLKNPTDRDSGTYSCTVYRSGRILAKKQVLLKVKADSLIMAIDFGSGYSGYAFNLKPREEGGETQLKRWGKELGLDSPKTPTCILFDEDEQFLEFGYEAKTAYSNMRREEAEKHYFFEDFKRKILNTVSNIKDLQPELLLPWILLCPLSLLFTTLRNYPSPQKYGGGGEDVGAGGRSGGKVIYHRLSPTWLDGSVLDSVVSLDGFKLIRMDRTFAESGKKRGGGLAVFVNERWCNVAHVHVKQQICCSDVEILAYVTCATSDSKTLDLFYANVKDAYTSASLPPLGRLDHNLVYLLPHYIPLVFRVDCWAEHAHLRAVEQHRAPVHSLSSDVSSRAPASSPVLP
ncbi:uncharacterized protein LOC105924182 [Fundulus heteroclitus]|uniref:uncharacterized protein LOC105924182 n=1 Tax=Fundulus heteroclitus TaxID=8078 RepID=UPI00165B6604|nr:uncharacterized protein LOC105924182 [Fundulus heteroclitus]